MKYPITRVALALALLLGIGASRAETQMDEAGESASSDQNHPVEKGRTEAKSPHAAFEAGEYDRAAQVFAERAERRPGDIATQLNLGSALHKLEDYDGARSAFGRAAEATDRRLRAKATYDLGNTAYRQGRLDEAIERYREALELDSDDEDAKHNLEFVQLELDRRKQQAQQRQEQQGNQPDSKDQEESSDDGEGDEQGEQRQSDDQEPSDNQNGEKQKPRDSDGDGLSDQQERSADNPTDPQKRDTDGDGRSDGEEDANRNGKVDPGESDPTRADQRPEQQEEGQEQSDGEQPEGEQPEQGQARDPGQELTLDPEQVKRLLAALEDHRPPASRGKERAGKKAKRAKDW